MYDKGMDSARIAILSAADGPELPLVDGTGSARAVVWPGTGARHRAMHLIELAPSSATVVQEHPGEAVYCVLRGAGSVHDGDRDAIEEIVTGAMLHVEAGTPYRLVAGADGMTAIGGPAPVDDRLYEAS